MDRAAAERLMAQLSRLEAEPLLVFDQAERALQGVDDVRVEAVPKDARLSAVVLHLGGRCPAGEGIVALRARPDRRAGCVPASALSSLAAPPDQLVDVSLVSLSPEEIERVEMVFGRGGSERLEMARQGKGFRLLRPKLSDVPAESARQLLELLAAARGRVVEGREARRVDFRNRRGRIIVTPTGLSVDKAQQELVVSFPQASGKTYVLRKQDETVLEIDRETARSLAPNLTVLRPHDLLLCKPEDLREIKTRIAGHTQHVRCPTPTSCKLLRPEGFRADSHSVDELIRTLVSLRAERWMPTEDLEAARISEFSDRISLVVAKSCELRGGLPDSALKEPDRGDHRTLELLLGTRAPGGRYASLGPRTGVFILSQDSLDQIDRLLIDRSLFSVTAEQVSRVVLERDERRIELGSVEARFTQRSSQHSLDENELGELTEALASLRAEGAVHVGAPLRHEGLGEPQLSVTVEWRDEFKDRPSRWHVGASDAWRKTAIYYARAAGVDATFAIARVRLEPIFQALQ